MQKNLIILDKTLANKVLIFFKSPITALLAAVLISTFFYFISLSYKTPAYFITNPELIAQKADNKLKIQYDNIELNNIYSSSLIIWNDGDKYIDYDDFIKNNPIKIYSNDNINILSITLSKSSREELKFKTNINNDTINISLKNDEAFEEGDGAKFLILFNKSQINSQNNPKFKLESRIKGTKNGFEFKDLSNYKSKNDKLSLYILWGVILFFTSFRILILYIYKKPIVFRKTEAIVIFGLITITSYMTIQYIFFSTNLNWL
ncbi:hypothetical protein OZ668_02185 [Elizabethkingia sp. HX XZB]|uniref:hypothetical protein n=1 Tax=Elizabethkingia sp. HX XZB TaxID=3003193 RepID=UPI002A246F8C|nr:hypothetical protein [Elizabethkingia sp. HX XZB]MDX8566777.1 hypothetical protein [Elizabethkingia sp. HX XZB]